jgi:hypothetical protein
VRDRFRIGSPVTPLVVVLPLTVVFGLTGLICSDVVKSRVQLRPFPPTGTPVQYIAHEIKSIVSKSGVYVPLFAPVCGVSRIADYILNVARDSSEACRLHVSASFVVGDFILICKSITVLRR